MNVAQFAPYAKTIAAIAGAVVVSATCLADGTLSGEDITTIIAAWSTVFAVYFVKNKR